MPAKSSKPLRLALALSVASLLLGTAQVSFAAATTPLPGSSDSGNVNKPPTAKQILKEDDHGVSPPPPVMDDLQEQTSLGGIPGADTTDSPDHLGLQIRVDALREAALSYGARGGLAYRTFQIQRRLAEYDQSLSKAFDFNRLLIAAPSGLMIEPPVITEAQKAVIVKSGGQAAAVADRVYRINRVAGIVTAGRNWHLYLERDWGKVTPPPGILLPKDDDEREAWRKYIKEGWDAGVRQAEETFEADLDHMTNDFVGMVRYRELLAQGMVSPPYALADDRGITGGGSEMRVGDRGLTITGPSMLIPRNDVWTPAPR